MRHNSDGMIIVGGGLAGQRCVEALRRRGYTGAIRLVCAEQHLPYDRPPLSKELLSGAIPRGRITYRPAGWFEQNDVDVLLGVRAVGLDPGSRRLGLSDGGSLRYRWLLIATGSRPRSLPLLDGFENVSKLRTVDDCQRLRSALKAGSRLAVIGAGFIGLEVAATARRLGLDVVVVEAAPSPLAHVLGPRMGEWFTSLHRAEGVEMHTGCAIESVIANGAVTGLRLADGQTLVSDHVVVGVGVAPEVDWLAGNDLHTPAGVPVDIHGRTAVPRVLAAGDAAATFDPVSRRNIFGSHWEAAGRQGARAAHVMLGLDPGAAPPTSFWTDQYGIRIQYLGDARLADGIEIDGEPDSRSFTATYTRAGQVVAALLVDRPRELPRARQMIEKGAQT